ERILVYTNRVIDIGFVAIMASATCICCATWSRTRKIQDTCEATRCVNFYVKQTKSVSAG
ncbi:MAG: hypothetical protein RR505_11665, partial [Raoultibacter sp.]